MCGRYYVNQGIIGGMEADFPEIRGALSQLCADQFGNADIVPGMSVPVLYDSGGRTVCDLMSWGFPDSHEKGSLIINARSETLDKKPMFREALQHHRCIAPAAGFYEWTKEKEQVRYTWEAAPVIYLGAVFRMIQNVLRFVVITREANSSVRDVHGRMPLLFSRQDAFRWIEEGQNYSGLLDQKLPHLDEHRVGGPQQLSLL
ncbi:MAG: SOS response-associated peptidase [Eubacterium sp.]|jgi:putative SOS response-associated peptidase YedK